jgi:hypothetical protein
MISCKNYIRVILIIFLNSSYTYTMCDNKNTWKIMSVIKQKILEANGFIFGGFVRDSILHDHFAQMYYSYCENSDLDNNDIVDYYADTNFHSESSERLTLPSDIDCYLTDNDYNCFINSLQNVRLSCKVLFCRNASVYIDGFPTIDNTIKHRRITVFITSKFFITELNKLPFEFNKFHIINSILASAPSPVYVDILTSEKQYNEPFFTDLDFECNALYLTKHGLSISSKILSLCDVGDYAKYVKINKVINNIIEKKAIFLHPNSTSKIIAKRTNKLMDKGWTIQDKFKCYTSIFEHDYEGYCIICHDKLPPNHFKFTCCDGRYHKKCMQTTIEVFNRTNNDSNILNHCFMCKKDIPILESHSLIFDP